LSFFANSFLILKLHDTIPPYALTGSQLKAKLNDFKLFFSTETPQGFACLIITVPLFFSKDLEIDRAEKISL